MLEMCQKSNTCKAENVGPCKYDILLLLTFMVVVCFSYAVLEADSSTNEILKPWVISPMSSSWKSCLN